jgi:hypothetical protein
LELSEEVTLRNKFLGATDNADIFLQQAKKHMNNIEKLTLDDIPESHWLVFCFLGLASNEEEKLYHWAKWKSLFEVIDPIIKPFSNRKLQSFQSIVVREKLLPNGFRKIESKKAATGGARKWTYEANHDISTKFVGALDKRIIFHGSDIWASDEVQPTQGWDFYLKYVNCIQLDDSAFNQSINLFLSRTLLQKFDDAIIIINLVKALAELSGCIRLGQTSRRWAYIDKQFSETGVSADFLMDRDYSGQYNSLDLADNPFGKWEVLI